MSPPCQPYTRIGLQQGSVDARAKSFLHLLNVLGEMEHKPKYILVENVKGFEVFLMKFECIRLSLSKLCLH
jgi:tRNA (cytosine38-C5)-methyltransferase